MANNSIKMETFSKVILQMAKKMVLESIYLPIMNNTKENTVGTWCKGKEPIASQMEIPISDNLWIIAEKDSVDTS